jgi:hypothetical protein
MNQFYLEKIVKNRKKDIIDYVREFYQYNSKINGVGRLQDYISEQRRRL